MSTLISRLHWAEILTLPEFTHDVVTRLSFDLPQATVTQPEPHVLVITCPGKPAVTFNLQASYRDYQKAPRSKDQIIGRLVRWVRSTLALS